MLSELKNRIPLVFRSEIRSISELDKLKKFKRSKKDDVECVEQP